MKYKQGVKIFVIMAVILILASFLFSLKATSNQLNSSYKNFEPFKMIFLPDTHISFKENSEQKTALDYSFKSDEKGEWILYNESFVIFQDVIKTIKTLSNLGFIVFGGDLINNDDNSLSDLSLFIDSIDNFSHKYFTILGDREADLKDGYTKQDFCTEFRRNGFSNPDITYWAEQYSDNILLVGLDTSIENKFEGNLSEEQLLWFDNTLKSNPDKFTVIFMHHPAIETALSDKNVWKKFVLQNSKEFLKIINKYPQVKLILSGHHHNYGVKNLNGKLFISLPSIATYPNQYKILTIYPDKVEVENKNISFKQIIKKAKNILVKTDYAKEYDIKNPKNVIKFQEGDKIKKTKVFYYSGK